MVFSSSTQVAQEWFQSAASMVEDMVDEIYDETYAVPQTRHNSALSGAAHLRELRVDNVEKLKEAIGFYPSSFETLVDELTQFGGLRATKRVLADEKTAIFLYIVVHGCSVRQASNRWQHSTASISAAFHAVLEAVTSKGFRNHLMQQPKEGEMAQAFVRSNPKFEAFKDAVGAIDGTHVKACPPAAVAGAHRNRHKGLSQNVLSACRLDNLTFCYCLPGWEGSAADSAIFADARQKSLRIPAGKCVYIRSPR